MKRAVLILVAILGSKAASADDMHCLALNLYHEARGVSEEDQMAVAHATLNRVRSDKFPDSICAVVKQARKKNGQIVRHKCQFSWYCDGKSDKPKNGAAWKRAKRIAKIAVRWYEGGEDFSEGATFYHANWTRPYWAKHFKKTVKLDGHTFYKE